MSDSTKTCYNCQETGHYASTCTNEKKVRDAGAGGDRKCYNCGEAGHMSSACTKERGAGGGGDRKCYNCGEAGHMSSACTNPRKERNAGADGDQKCFNCQEMGHMSSSCPKPKKEQYVPSEVDEELLFALTISAGDNFDNLSRYEVSVSGDNVLTPVSSFAEAGLRPLLLRNIEKCGYKVPTPIQRYTLPNVMNGRDVVGCAQTGSGKTAAFLIPIINQLLKDGFGGEDSVARPEALIIAPTRELAIQIKDEARKFAMSSALRCCILYGGTSVGHQLATIRRGCNILVATLGRLAHCIREGYVSLNHIRFVVLDEADRLLDGNFLENIEELFSHHTMPPMDKRVTLLFSATMPQPIMHVANKHIPNTKMFLSVGQTGAANQDVTQKVLLVEKKDKLDTVIEILRGSSDVARTLIFVENQHFCDFLGATICQSGFPATTIHGARLQPEREIALNDFRSGRKLVLVATNVAARGLDIADVKHVINYDMPGVIEDYVHRIGRTGRVGNLGLATTFFDPVANAGMAQQLADVLASSNQEVPDFLIGRGGGAAAAGHDGAGASNGGFVAPEEEELW